MSGIILGFLASLWTAPRSSAREGQLLEIFVEDRPGIAIYIEGMPVGTTDDEGLFRRKLEPSDKGAVWRVEAIDAECRFVEKELLIEPEEPLIDILWYVDDCVPVPREIPEVINLPFTLAKPETDRLVDGSLLVYLRAEDGGCSLETWPHSDFTVDPDETEPDETKPDETKPRDRESRQFLKVDLPCGQVKLSPQGKHLAITKGGITYVLEVVSKRPLYELQQALGAGWVAWSTSEEEGVYIRRQGEGYALIDLGRPATPIFVFDRKPVSVTFSADDKHVVVSVPSKGGPPAASAVAYRLPLVTVEVGELENYRLLFKGAYPPESVAEPAWSATEDFFVFRSLFDLLKATRVGDGRFKAEAVAEDCDAVESPSVSPSGQWLSFLASKDRKGDDSETKKFEVKDGTGNTKQDPSAGDPFFVRVIDLTFSPGGSIVCHRNVDPGLPQALILGTAEKAQWIWR